MALAGRIVVILFAFVMASLAAGAVIIFAYLLPGWIELYDTEALYRGISAAIVFMGVMVAGIMLLPAILVVLITEGFRLRSVLIYTLFGGAAALVAYHQLGLGSASDLPRAEIVGAAGIAAGFVYWALAGRNAGRWRRQNEAGQGAAPP